MNRAEELLSRSFWYTRTDLPILNHDFCLKPTGGLSLSSSFISFAVTNAFTRRQRRTGIAQHSIPGFTP